MKPFVHSSDPQINALFDTYLKMTGRDMVLVPSFERWCFNALKSGVTTTDLILVIRERQKLIKKGERYEPCLKLSNLFGDDDKIACVVEEAAALKAKLRKACFPKGKVEVLKCTGRNPEPPSPGCRPISDIIKIRS